MKAKNGIPKQEYELISVTRQGMESGTALVCEDCGRVIFNFAVIRGKEDGKKYTVGLTCVKKLLNKIIYFNEETLWKYEDKVAQWNSAFNTRKWVDKQLATGKYVAQVERYSESEFCVKLIYSETMPHKGWQAGVTKSLSVEFLPLFLDFEQIGKYAPCVPA